MILKVHREVVSRLRPIPVNLARLASAALRLNPVPSLIAARIICRHFTEQFGLEPLFPASENSA